MRRLTSHCPLTTFHSPPDPTLPTVTRHEHAPQLSPNRLRAPRENRGVVVDPPWSEVPRSLEENMAVRSGWEYDFQGISASRLIAEARPELLRRGNRLEECLRRARSNLSTPTGPILLAGHQPQMFHPGVWWKNFALGRLAEKHARNGRQFDYRQRRGRQSVPLSSRRIARNARAANRWLTICPNRPCLTRNGGSKTARCSRVSRIERPRRFPRFVKNSLLEKYWPMVVAQSRPHGIARRIAGPGAASVGRFVGLFDLGSSAERGVRSARVLAFRGASAGPNAAISADL